MTHLAFGRGDAVVENPNFSLDKGKIVVDVDWEVALIKEAIAIRSFWN